MLGQERKRLRDVDGSLCRLAIDAQVTFRFLPSPAQQLVEDENNPLEGRDDAERDNRLQRRKGCLQTCLPFRNGLALIP